MAHIALAGARTCQAPRRIGLRPGEGGELRKQAGRYAAGQALRLRPVRGPWLVVEFLIFFAVYLKQWIYS